MKIDKEIVEHKIFLSELHLVQILNYNEKILLQLERRFGITLVLRGNIIIFKGSSEFYTSIEKILQEYEYLVHKNNDLTQKDIDMVIESVKACSLNTKNQIDDDKNIEKDNKNIPDDNIILFRKNGDPIRTKSDKQKEYYQKVKHNDLTFSIGPAGTGKTFLAVAMALASLNHNKINRIIITRPAVESGESLGFLPGDLKDKIDPYLRPIYDAIIAITSADMMKKMQDQYILEIVPLAYMRGRTLNNAFIILDEAQNATVTQMKMFLTRLGMHSKVIVTGDITQTDLKSESGLLHAINVLQNIKGIEFVYFDTKDVVRHKLVAKIIDAYGKDESKKYNISETNYNIAKI